MLQSVSIPDLEAASGETLNNYSKKVELWIRLGQIWPMLSDPKSSDTTFVFLNGDYKNAFSFFLLLQKVR